MSSKQTILPVDRWNVLVLIGASVLMLVVVWADYVTSPALLLFYIAVQVVVGSMVRGYWWAVLAVAATILWLAVRRIAPGADAMHGNEIENWQLSLWNAGQRLTVLGLVGFLCFRLRLYSRSPESFTSSHDVTGMLSAVGLRETLSRGHVTHQLAQGPVALLLLDMERRVSAYAGQSSEYGALVGAMVSKVVMDQARPSDLCVRLSPNHFLVIMPNTDLAAASQFNADVQASLPEVVRSLNDSVSISTLLLHSPRPEANIGKMRAYAENRLITLKVLGMGHHHSESWPLASAAAPVEATPAQVPLTTG